jgi:hypothetical protein
MTATLGRSTTDSNSKSSSNGFHVFIPAALNRPTHTLYSICMMVQPTAQEWTVNRRYSQFLQLKQDILQELSNSTTSCPSCCSFERAILAFTFPEKTWLRTNKIVRKRVKSLQLFLQLIVERIFNNVLKCFICGDRMRHMVRPFLLRGAQPLGDSTIKKIQHSLQLQSYAIIHRPPRKFEKDPYIHHHDHHQQQQQQHQQQQQQQLEEENNTTISSSKKYEEKRMKMSDAFPSTCNSNNSSINSSSTNKKQNQETLEEEHDGAYGYQYDNTTERCQDPAIPLKEAIKDIVLPEGVAATFEESVFRLSTMWDAFAEMETLPFPPTQSSSSSSSSSCDDDEEEEVQYEKKKKKKKQGKKKV